MLGSKTRLIKKLREMLARAEGERDEARQAIEGYRSIAEKALEVAKDKYFGPHPRTNSGVWAKGSLNDEKGFRTSATFVCGSCDKEFPSTNENAGRDYQDHLAEHQTSYLPNYQAPRVENCPQCCVSVRFEGDHAECPNCHCTFGFGDE